MKNLDVKIEMLPQHTKIKLNKFKLKHQSSEKLKLK